MYTYVYVHIYIYIYIYIYVCVCVCVCMYIHTQNTHMLYRQKYQIKSHYGNFGFVAFSGRIVDFCWSDNLLVDRWVECLINRSTVKLDGDFNGCFLVGGLLG